MTSRTSQELQEPKKLQELYDLFLRYPKVSTDTRRIEPGSIFFALKGGNFDGNAFAIEAIRLGAVASVVDDPALEGEGLFLVENVLEALQALARLHRERMGIPVIAITGTNGKTTTKELTACVLETTYKVLYTQGNLNNHIGVPLTLLKMQAEHQLAIIEMGASKPGDIDELCQIALPDYGLITNVGSAHLQGFGTVEQVIQTKGELYRNLKVRGGTIFRNSEDDTLARLAEGIPSILYGTREGGLAIGRATDRGDLKLRFVWSAPSLGVGEQEQSTQLVGAYNLSNALAAIAIGLFFDVSPADIRKALESYSPSNNRSQLIRSERNIIVADAYNANPTSMRTAVENLFALSDERPRLLILGDMNELGRSSGEAHHSLRLLVEEHLRPSLDEVYYCGPLWRQELGDAPARAMVFGSASELASHLKAHTPSGRLILVKGSNGIGLGQIIPHL